MQCIICEREFPLPKRGGANKITCSPKCQRKRRAQLRKAAWDRWYAQSDRHKPVQPRPCVVCSTEFTPGGTRSDAIYCSRKCGRLVVKLRSYGITVEEYVQLQDRQKGKCAACLLPLGGRIDIDHSHRTGAVRGLVHPKCNAILGFADDDANLLRRLARYAEDSHVRRSSRSS